MSIRVINSDKAYNFLHEDAHLKESVLTYLDNFNLASTEEFVEKVISVVEQELMVSKVKEDIFIFTGLDVKVVSEGIFI